MHLGPIPGNDLLRAGGYIPASHRSISAAGVQVDRIRCPRGLIRTKGLRAGGPWIDHDLD
jgi:hypothetical protein